MADIVISVVAKVSEYLVAPIGRQLGYLYNYRSNLDKLEEQVEKLGDARGRLQRDVDEADRQGDEIEPDVQKWLTRTEVIIKTAKELIEDERAANTSCFNLKLRYQRSRQAKKQSGDIGKIQEENNLTRLSYYPPPQAMWSTRLRDCEALDSRASILNEIIKALKKDDIRMIGVWGMGGVGKTTLANQVAKKAGEDKLFEKVVMALNISRVPIVTKIQGEIASMLGLKFEEEEELGRAARLSKSLQKNKTVLVILDDIWEELSLENIGIPYGDAHRGCKVLLTSRKRGVLSRKMGTQINFHVQHLCEEEAWSLFKKTAGDSAEQHKSIAIKVLGECDGLPVAIVTVAKALKDQSEAVWNNALQELKNSAAINIEDVDEKVYSCLELSYNHLKGDEVKRLFLLCGMLGYGDISMDQLLKYGMGLDLFEHVSSLEQIRNKLVTLVKILKDSSLLLDVEYKYDNEWPGVFFGSNYENRFVRMHDVVGDVARAIAAKDPHRFVVIKEALGLEEWQRKEEFRNCSRISLQCKDLHELPERLVCPKLEFFLLNSDDDSLRIPDTFFEKSELLRVLGLSKMNLTPLPSSLGFLSNLRTLCVQGCTLQDIAVIGELKKLQVLNFASCEIERLPKEMMQLTDLRVLDLWDCSYLEVIPQNVISSLSRLEHLCFAKSFIKWGAEGFGSGESNNACLSELNNLSYLKTLCIEIRDPNLLSKDLVFEKLTRYVISVSPVEEYVNYKKSARKLKLWRVNKPCLVDYFSKLFKTVEDLELSDLEDTKHVLYELDTDDFLQLKCLDIRNCPGIQYIVDSTKGVPSHSAFPILEELSFYGLDNMDAVCYGPIPEGSFGKLRSLSVDGCKRLKSFISLPMEQGRDGSVLPEMGSLDSARDFSTGASATQELSTSDVPTPFFNEQVTLPSLEFLLMFELDNVVAMWHKQLPLESCCKLKVLEISECNKLLNVFPSNILKGLQSLEYVSIRNCDSIEEIFDLRGVNCNEIHDIATIPLKQLSLERLNSLKSVWNKDPEGLVSFQNLGSLCIIDCPCLKCLFPETIAKGLVQLNVLRIRKCGVVEIVANENGDEIMSSLFPKLTSLTLEELDKLKGFSRGKCIARWPHLKELIMRKCDQVETLFQEIDSESYIDTPIQQPFFLLEKVSFPNLKILKLSGLPKLREIWDYQLPLGSFCNLHILEVEKCASLLNVVPNYLIASLQNLEELNVEKCDQLEEVFDLEELDHADYEHVGMFSKLEKLKLIDLPKLRHICNKDLQQISCFQNLNLLRVKQCGSLTHLLSSGIALGLVRLKDLSVEHCSMIKEIIMVEDRVADEIIFPQTTQLSLLSLPNLASFYMGTRTHEKVHMGDCDTLACVLFHEKVSFPNLEILKLSDLSKLTEIWDRRLPLSSFCNLHILEVKKCPFLFNVVPNNLIASLQNLEKLNVEECDQLKEVFDLEGLDHTDYENARMLSKLEELKLIDLPQLGHICNKDLRQISFFQNLRVLQLKQCDSLTCLFSASMALGLVQLNNLWVEHCSQIKEIIKVEDGIADKIIFPQTTQLSLLSLPMLTSFYLRTQAPGMLFNEEVAFPNMEFLYVSGLDNVKKIWHNKLLADSFSKLKETRVENCKELLNISSSNVMNWLPSLEFLRIASCGKLTEVFDLEVMNVQEDVRDSRLGRLVLDDLQNLEHICNKVPGKKLCLQNLRFLEVHNCGRVKKLFSPYTELEGVKEIIRQEEGAEEVIDKIEFPELSSLSLKSLPSLASFYPASHTLKMVGPGDHDILITVLFHEKVAFPCLENLDISNLDGVEKIWHNEFVADSFGKLKRLSVWSCNKLRNIIPSNMLNRLLSLQILKIVDSNSLEEIFDLESIDSKENNDIPTLQLRELCLDKLETLKCVWNKAPQGLLTYQNLKSIRVSHCPSLKIPFPGYVVRSLLQVKEVDMNSHRVKEIVAHKDMAKVVSMFLFPEVTSLTNSCLEKLKCFYLGLDNLEWPMLKRPEVESCESLEMLASKLDKPVEQPIFLCDKVAFPNLEILNLSLKLKEIQDLHVLFGALSNLKTLIVEDSPYLLSLLSPQFIQCLNNLKKLTVKNCGQLEEVFDLKGLDHGEVEHVEMHFQLEEVSLIDLPMLRYICNNSPRQVLCFKDLKLLQVKRCQVMTYLFSPSMVLGLVQLQNLRIEHCDTMKEIVTAEEGVTDKIIFPQITRVSLLKLPKLKSFYLSQSLEKIHMGDSNSAPGALFNEKVKFPKLEILHVSGLDNVKKIWHHQLLADSFGELKKTEVENCTELLTISSSNVMNWLPSLEFLRIASCGKLTEVFDLEVMNVQEDVRDNRLGQLVLDDLQNLEHICNKVRGKKLCLQNLRFLKVHNCGRMKKLFSPYTELEGVKEIIGQEEGAEEVIDKIEFPELISLSLKSLPRLASFYPGRFGPGDHGILITVLFDEMVAFPSLSSLHISGLDNINDIWNNKRTANSFSRLEKVKVEDCNKLQNGLPLFVLKWLSSLQFLRIANCGKLKVVFDLEGANILDDATETQLNKLELHDLPQLQYIWNRDPYGILTFQNLDLVEVLRCQVLKGQFPSCLTRDLSQPEKQLIRSRWKKDLEGKEKGEDFVFPEVTYDKLLDLRKTKGKEVVVVNESDYVGEISEDMPGSSG